MPHLPWLFAWTGAALLLAGCAHDTRESTSAAFIPPAPGAVAAATNSAPGTNATTKSTATTSTNAPRRVEPVRSPEIGADRRVTFRLRAPQATNVAVIGQWPGGRAAMHREGTNGVWTATVGPIGPGVWEYSFSVDGLVMIDPGNPAIKPMREPRTSILHLPATPASLVDFQDVPHGTVRWHTYASRSLGRLRELAVYTPPGYDASLAVRYPVLYLQHGSGDNQATWTVHGKSHWILDNLLAAGQAKPMIVVMMDGHAIPPAGMASFGTNITMFQRDLLEDVLPWVDANYRTLPNAASRAIAGLSMGGGQALVIGLNHPELFAWVGAFSAGTPTAEQIAAVLADREAFNRKSRLLWIACGSADFLRARNEELVQRLRGAGIQHTWLLTPGDHSWPVWRDYLGQFLPRLFQPPVAVAQ